MYDASRTPDITFQILHSFFFSKYLSTACVIHSVKPVFWQQFRNGTIALEAAISSAIKVCNIKYSSYNYTFNPSSGALQILKRSDSMQLRDRTIKFAKF